MAFRADEAIQRGIDRAKSYLIPRPQHADQTERNRCEEALMDIIDDIGPVIDTYPTWHPLVRSHNARYPTTTPNARCGYKGLDHTVFFRNGFITCPYADSGKAEQVIESVYEISCHPIAYLTAEKLDVALYHPNATSVLVKCEWDKPLGDDGMIPASIAVPLILEKEVPCWHWSEVGETWETMRHYFLGSPHGARSSLFVNQETGQTIKRIWNALIHTGMFGPIMVG